MTAYPSWFASPLVQRGVIRALGSDDVVVVVTVRWAPRGRLGRTTLRAYPDWATRDDLTFRELSHTGRWRGDARPIVVRNVRNLPRRSDVTGRINSRCELTLSPRDVSPDTGTRRFTTAAGHDVTDAPHPDAGRPNVPVTARLLRVTPLDSRDGPGGSPTRVVSSPPSPPPPPPTAADARAARRFLAWARRERGWFLSYYPDGSASTWSTPLNRHDGAVVRDWRDHDRDPDRDRDDR